MKYQRIVVLIVLVGGMSRGAPAADWITEPSYYTHDPMSGQRVNQYTKIGPFYGNTRSDYMQSGYRHTRSSIQAGGSIDHYHLVEEWGRPVRPYGEWQYPNRPYSVPYQQWGPQFPPGYGYGFGGGIGGGWGGAGGGIGGGGNWGPGGGQQPGAGVGPAGQVPFPYGGNSALLPWNTDQLPNYDNRNLVPWRVIPGPPGPHHGP